MDASDSRKRHTYRVSRRSEAAPGGEAAPGRQVGSGREAHPVRAVGPVREYPPRRERRAGNGRARRARGRGRSRHARKGETLAGVFLRAALHGLRDRVNRLHVAAGSLGRTGLTGLRARAGRYSAHLTALAGVVIVILSVYLIQQGFLVPSSFDHRDGAPVPASGETAGPPSGAAGGTAGGQDGVSGGTSEDPGAAATGDAGGGPTDGASSGSSGAAATAPGPGTEPGLTGSAGQAGQGDGQGETRMVVDLEDGSSTVVGPLSRGDCLRGLVRPAAGDVVRGFGFYESPLLLGWRYHPGVDIRTAVGAAVHAAQAGMVTDVRRSASEAWRVEIAHGFGVVTVYAHLGAIEVRAGDEIRRGQRIGTVGLPGDYEYDLGPHLHYEIRVDGQAIEPDPYLGG